MGEDVTRRLETTCCIVGGGPAGMMAGLLFARAGVPTIVLEKHGDFLRDFRGDTVHPSTLAIMAELGLLDPFLKRPHQRFAQLSASFGGRTFPVVDFSRLDTPCPFIAFMPQWDFLDFLADDAERLPTFTLRRSTEALDLVTEGKRVVGVMARDSDGLLEIRAKLTIAADGRRSVLREAAGFAVSRFGAPIDVLWFRLPKQEEMTGKPLFHAARGGVLITIDRAAYWQCALVIPKGGIAEVQAAGLEAFRQRVARIVPNLADAVGSIDDWSEVKLLTVAVDRLESWHRPGLICIGDAAHAMSPIGGVGINLAIQDAVAAANLLAASLADGRLRDHELAMVARRRLWPVRVVQRAQIILQDRLLMPLLKDAEPEPPLLLRLVSRWPFAQGLIARAIGLGLRPEHVRSPQAPLPRRSPSG